MSQDRSVLWWSMRPAQNRKPATYTCPFCRGYLPALSEHVLIAPEGNARHRRHAHSSCVVAERAAGRLPTREEWLRSQPSPPPLWRRLSLAISGLIKRGGSGGSAL